MDKFAGFYLEEISEEHQNIINSIVKYFRPKKWVRGIFLEGSYGCKHDTIDIFSDIDLGVAITPDKKGYIEKNIEKILKSFCKPLFFHRSPCGRLTYSAWILPFIRLDISFRTLDELVPSDYTPQIINILFDKKDEIKTRLKNQKILVRNFNLKELREMDAQFWMTIFFIYTKIEKNDFCSVYDSFHFIVKSILMRLRRLDYNSPPGIYLYNIKKKDPYLYKELEIILDFPNEPIDSLLRAVILYKNLLKRINRQEGLKFKSEAEPLVLRTIQRGLIAKPKKWY